MVKNILSFLLFFICIRCNSKSDPNVVNAENAKRGENLFNTVGCLMCHSVSGEIKYGPPLNSVYDKEVFVIRKGKRLSLKADRQYILRSLQDPEFEKLENFQNKKMPELSLSPEDIDYLVDYLIFINTNKDSLSKSSSLTPH
jgi:hypothetical protein